MSKTYYLTPKSPTAASSIELGSTRAQAIHTLAELSYSSSEITAALDEGYILTSMPEGQTDLWTVKVAG